MHHPITWLGYICIACVVLGVGTIAYYLWKRPPLNLGTKLTLLLGLGVFPAGAATSSTVTGMQATTERHFCGSCHVMDPYVNDAGDPKSQTLAARHGRNPYFGHSNCYTCHRDYGMFGYAMTKIGGMGHVYQYYLKGWRKLTIDQALDKIHLAKPYDNNNCRQCHTGTLADWATVPEHVSLAKELEQNRVSCASSGCHGYAHPFSKKEGKLAPALPRSAVGARHRPDAPVSSALPEDLRQRVEAAKEVEQKAHAAASVDREAELKRAREAAREAARQRTKGAPDPGKAAKDGGQP